ncbi:MAG: hypothetical protein WKF30_13195 [Pyrinomonadaceae bacterium]
MLGLNSDLIVKDLKKQGYARGRHSIPHAPGRQMDGFSLCVFTLRFFAFKFDFLKRKESQSEDAKGERSSTDDSNLVICELESIFDFGILPSQKRTVEEFQAMY